MSKKRLLVIEDDMDVAEMLLVYFSSQGFEVLNAMTGSEGVAIARAKFPNLILLDVMLPDMDGFDVCKALRTTTLTKFIPTIFLTQRDGRADKVAGLELGADDYITKPFDVEELRLRVQGSLRRSSREQLQDPHTGLPTSAVIDETHDLLIKKPGLTQLRVQLVGFQPFRDKYGFMAADEALAYVGQTFREGVANYGTPNDFVGQADEDRYVIFTFALNVGTLVEKLVNDFADGARKLYNFIDSEQGYVLINEATDYEQHIPLMHIIVSPMAEGVLPS
jgi:PleD family two-component response regulator